MSRLPFLFIITGMFGFLLFHGISLISFSDWFNEGLRGPSGWFHVHLFVLGWATMLAMGAVYQLINVILQSKIYSEKLGFIHYVVFTIGLFGLLFGFLNGKTLWIAGFAILTFIGILLFGWNMTITLVRAKQWDAITISATCAVFYLVLTGIFGMAMGINFVTGKWNLIHEQLFGAHIWLGTVGWFGLLITGFSFKMLPMFYLSHDFPTVLQKVILIVWNIAVLWGATSFLIGSGFWIKWLALLIITVAMIIYNLHLIQIKNHRFKKNPGRGIKWSVYASQAFMIFAIMMTFYSLLFPERMLDEKSIILAGWVYLGGWVSYTILCYASKIVPFLWWTYKYGKQAGKPGTPLMADLLDEKKVEIGLAILAVFAFLLIIGIAAGANLLIVAFGSAFSLFSILYMLLIGLVFSR